MAAIYSWAERSAAERGSVGNIAPSIDVPHHLYSDDRKVELVFYPAALSADDWYVWV